MVNPKKDRPLLFAGVVLGLGFGGFADGIVLHHILGWHHMICVTDHCQPTSIAHLQRQNTQDGIFDLALWIVTLIGVILLFRAARQPGTAWSGRLFIGSMLAGWGLFNLVEGVVDHHILGIHHVLPGHPAQLSFDILFLAAGATLLLTGWFLARPQGFSV